MVVAITLSDSPIFKSFFAFMFKTKFFQCNVKCVCVCVCFNDLQPLSKLTETKPKLRRTMAFGVCVAVAAAVAAAAVVIDYDYNTHFGAFIVC